MNYIHKSEIFQFSKCTKLKFRFLLGRVLSLKLNIAEGTLGHSLLAIFYYCFDLELLFGGFLQTMRKSVCNAAVSAYDQTFLVSKGRFQNQRWKTFKTPI